MNIVEPVVTTVPGVTPSTPIPAPVFSSQAGLASFHTGEVAS